MVEETKAPFNMAINTLERLGELLREINKIEQNIFLSLEQKQYYKVLAVKQFYIQASPLLTKDQRNDIGGAILSLESTEKLLVQNEYGHATKVKGKLNAFYK